MPEDEKTHSSIKLFHMVKEIEQKYENLFKSIHGIAPDRVDTLEQKIDTQNKDIENKLVKIGVKSLSSKVVGFYLNDNYIDKLEMIVKREYTDKSKLLRKWIDEKFEEEQK